MLNVIEFINKKNVIEINIGSFFLSLFLIL